MSPGDLAERAGVPRSTVSRAGAQCTATRLDFIDSALEAGSACDHDRPERLPRAGATAGWHRGRDFWLTTRRAPGATHCQYDDRSWGSATTFDPERVVVTADLAAFLVRRLRELPGPATEAAFPAKAAAGPVPPRPPEPRRATSCARGSGSWPAAWTAPGPGTAPARSTRSRRHRRTRCRRLRATIRPGRMGEALAARIETHLTASGPVTVRPASPPYLPAGHERGPILASVTVHIEDGPRRAWQQRLADEISARFRTARDVRLRRELRRPQQKRARVTAPAPGPPPDPVPADAHELRHAALASHTSG